jgi:hypothetical protein
MKLKISCQAPSNGKYSIVYGRNSTMVLAARYNVFLQNFLSISPFLRVKEYQSSRQIVITTSSTTPTTTSSSTTTTAPPTTRSPVNNSSSNSNPVWNEHMAGKMDTRQESYDATRPLSNLCTCLLKTVTPISPGGGSFKEIELSRLRFS